MALDFNGEMFVGPLMIVIDSLNIFYSVSQNNDGHQYMLRWPSGIYIL